MDNDDLKKFITAWISANMNDGDLSLSSTELHHYPLSELESDVHEMIDSYSEARGFSV